MPAGTKGWSWTYRSYGFSVTISIKWHAQLIVDLAIRQCLAEFGNAGLGHLRVLQEHSGQVGQGGQVLQPRVGHPCLSQIEPGEVLETLNSKWMVWSFRVTVAFG